MVGERSQLLWIVASDLWHHIVYLILALLITVSALGVTLITHKSRALNAAREELLREQNSLEMEWRHLILEERVLVDAERVEQLAGEKLNMRHPDPRQSVMVRRRICKK